MMTSHHEPEALEYWEMSGCMLPRVSCDALFYMDVGCQVSTFVIRGSQTYYLDPDYFSYR